MTPLGLWLARYVAWPSLWVFVAVIATLAHTDSLVDDAYNAARGWQIVAQEYESRLGIRHGLASADVRRCFRGVTP